MKRIQYLGSAQFARVTAETFQAAGLAGETVVWNGHGDVQLVEAESADYLAQNDGSRFVIVESDEQPVSED